MIFKIKKFLFYFENHIDNIKETLSIYRIFKNWSLLKIVIIITGTYFLQVINFPLEVLIKEALQYITPSFTTFKVNSITNSEYITFLTAIVAIGGVFIALYFSTLGAINATLYSTFSNNLRDLLYREKHGNTYIEFLSYTTFFAFTLVVFYLLGYEKLYIAIPNNAYFNWYNNIFIYKNRNVYI